jgi:prepilin-type processing-associated H-X9-DG protein
MALTLDCYGRSPVVAGLPTVPHRRDRRSPSPTDGPHDVVTSTWESYAYPSSRHAGGVNAAFCDGHVVFINEQIEPRVYAMLMTSNHHKSKYWDRASGLPDRKLPQPTDGSF